MVPEAPLEKLEGMGISSLTVKHQGKREKEGKTYWTKQDWL